MLRFAPFAFFAVIELNEANKHVQNKSHPPEKPGGSSHRDVADNANIDVPVDDIMHSPELTIDSDKWLTDAIAMFKRCKASHIAVVEHGEKVGIIRADDILHTYRFNAERQH